MHRTVKSLQIFAMIFTYAASEFESESESESEFVPEDFDHYIARKASRQERVRAG